MTEKTEELVMPPLVGTTQRFLGIVALIGILIASLQFVLVRQQVNGFLARQVDQSVMQALSRVQQRASQAQYLIDAVADLQDANPDLPPQTLRRFINMAGQEQNTVSYVFLANVRDDQPVEKTLVLDLRPQSSASAASVNLPNADDVIRRTSASGRPDAAVVKSGNGHGNPWLVLTHTISNKHDVRQVIVGFIPVERFLAELIYLGGSGVITQLAVSENAETQSAPFWVLHNQAASTGFFKSREVNEKIFLRDHAWNLVLTSSSGAGFSLLALLPYIILGIGLLLTWALVMYLAMARTRGTEVAKLASSLHGANDELNRRIAEEELMARALRESEQKYRAIFENAGIGICQIAPSGEWLNANRTMARILGCSSPQDLLLAQPDLHGQLFVDPQERAAWFARLRLASQREHETRLHTKDRQVIWVNMNGHAVCDVEGNVQYFECTMYDVTERRNAERALRQAIKQADFANRSKSEFLANMSHELRTPLNAIIGFSEIIKDQMFGQVGQPQYIEYAHDIYDSGELLLSLINDILDMSKIEAGKRELAESELDMADTVHSVVRLVSVRAKAGRVKLNVHVSHELPRVRAEEKAIKQILTNLLTNAIKFTPEGGAVTLSAQVSDSGRMAVMIEDTGIGIAPDDIAVALAPFGQIESVLSRKNQGTGLGLPLTKALVELHGGELMLESELGKGTIVTVLLPANRVAGRIA